MRRRTKIVATLGPASDDEQILSAMISAGMDVARLNISHGTAEEHRRRAANVRRVAERLGRVVAVMLDLPGPKCRALIDEPLDLVTGTTVRFRIGAQSTGLIAVTFPEMLHSVKPGERILLDDGRLLLSAEENDGETLTARVVTGGMLKPRKGINLPDSHLTISALTERDREALDLAKELDVDWIALSFVRSPTAADELRAELRLREMDLPILAKIERPEAVQQMAAIIDAFDGIMVARGDLGVEMPLEEVPRIQKMLITSARRRGKPVITATEMLESMKASPRPTRAEAADVANAILDGTDAVMLSVETAMGQYPVEAVRYMARIAETTDDRLGDRFAGETTVEHGMVIASMTHAACVLADTIGAQAIVAASRSGRTVRLLARHRPQQDLIATTPSQRTRRQLALVWGVIPLLLPDLHEGDDRLLRAAEVCFQSGAIPREARVVMVAEHPIIGGPGTPTIRVAGLTPDEIT